MTTDDHQLDNPLAALRHEVGDDALMATRSADRLEASLRVAYAERSVVVVPWWRRTIALAPLVVLLAVAVSVVLVLRTEAPSAALVVTGAENVTIVLPDGVVIVDPEDGFELPDGAVLEIGPSGMVVIDDVVIDEPARLAVVDGALVSDVIATTTAPERPDHLDPSPTATVAPVDVTTTTAAPVRDESATTTTVRSNEPEATTTTLARGGEGRPERDDRRDGRDGANRGDPETGDAETEPQPGPVVSISFTVERTDGDGALVSWTVDGALDGWTVLIRRSIGDREPVTVVAGGSLAGEMVESFDRDDQGRVRYRLVVVDEAGGEVASGPVQGLRR